MSEDTTISLAGWHEVPKNADIPPNTVALSYWDKECWHIHQRDDGYKAQDRTAARYFTRDRITAPFPRAVGTQLLNVRGLNSSKVWDVAINVAGLPWSKDWTWLLVSLGEDYEGTDIDFCQDSHLVSWDESS